MLQRRKLKNKQTTPTNYPVYYCIFFYFPRRKAVSKAATNKWPGNIIPVFKKDDKARIELDNLVASLAVECTFEPAGFNAQSTKQHILHMLNERRRRDRNCHDYTQVNRRLFQSFHD